MNINLTAKLGAYTNLDIKLDNFVEKTTSDELIVGTKKLIFHQDGTITWQVEPMPTLILTAERQGLTSVIVTIENVPIGSTQFYYKLGNDVQMPTIGSLVTNLTGWQSSLSNPINIGAAMNQKITIVSVNLNTGSGIITAGGTIIAP